MTYLYRTMTIKNYSNNSYGLGVCMVGCHMSLYLSLFHSLSQPSYPHTNRMNTRALYKHICIYMVMWAKPIRTL